MFWSFVNMSYSSRHGDKIIKTCIAVGLAYYVLPKIRDRLLDHILPRWMVGHHEMVRDLKEIVFEYLKTYKQNLPHPEQPIRVLEIGAGDGLNLENYPDRTRLVVVEPNRRYRSAVEKKIEAINFKRRNLDSSTFDPSLKLEAWYALKAENMAMFRGDLPNPAKIDGKIKTGEDYLIPDGDYPAGLFNAFVSTYVLCTVDNVERVLLNATSLVEPGGLLIMMEHVKPVGKLRNVYSCMLQPFWGFAFGHCHLRRTPHVLLKNHPKLSKAWEILFFDERDFPGSCINPVKRNIGLVARRLAT